MKPTFLLVPCLALLTISAGLSPAQESPTQDFFDIIGKSPAEVAKSISERNLADDMEVLVSGFVDLPMSPDHRKEFIAGLRTDLDAKANPFTRLCLVNLLEEDQAYDDALALLRQDVKSPHEVIQNQIREVALLWKSGKEAEAAEVASQIATPGCFPEIWLSLVRIDVIKNRSQEALRLLDFLEKRPNLNPDLRYALALQHLEIARRNGLTDSLIDNSSFPVLQAVWNFELGRKEKADECARAAGPNPSVEDIQLLMLAMGPDSPAGEFATAQLAKVDLSRMDRSILLGTFKNRLKRFEQWIAMPTGHGDTVDRLTIYDSDRKLDLLPEVTQAFWEIVKSHPDDPRLALFAAKSAFSDPDQVKPLLLIAAKDMREKPETNTYFNDPASIALETLAKTSDPAELEKVVLEAPGFDRLPTEDQLRYLIAAGLDKQVVKTMARCRFDLASQTLLGSSLISYFSQRATNTLIPEEAVTFILDHLPEIILGSFSKSDYSLSQRTRNTLTFLANQNLSDESLAKATNRLVTAAGERDPEMRQEILDSLPKPIWLLAGLDFSRPEKKSYPPSATPTAACLAISIFSPPDVTFIDTESSYQRRGRPINFGSSRMAANPASISLLMNSPWTQNISGATNPQRFDPATQANLRTLFGDDRSRTIIYDLMISTGVLPCPDPEVKARADQHMATLNTPLPEDPAVGEFLFVQKLAMGERPDEAALALEGYENYLLAARNRINNSNSILHYFIETAHRRILLDRLGLIKPAPKVADEAPKPPNPPSDYERLQFFAEAEKTNSPEAIALARDVLFRFIDSNRPDTWSEDNIAIRALVVTGNFQRFLDDLKSRMEAAGKSELEVQRALYRVHLYRFIHSKGEIYPYAKRVLELDPTDTAAAADVLAAATAENDQPLALKAMETLCRDSPIVLARALASLSKKEIGQRPKPGPLSLFGGPDARQVADLILSIPFKPDASNAYRPSGSASELLSLYLYFAQNDLSQLRPIMRWAQAFSPAHASDLNKIAEFLTAQKKQDAEAVALLADAYFTPPVAAQESDILFPLKSSPKGWNGSELNVYELRRLGILKPLAEAVSRYPATPETSKARVMIALAADPTPTTWDRIVIPFIDASPSGTRKELRRQLEQLISSNLPEADALNHRIAVEKQAADTSPPTIHSLWTRIRLAVKSETPADISTDWASLRRLLATRPQEQLQVLSDLSFPMAKIAADTEWQEFIQDARKTDGFPQSWIRVFDGDVPRDVIATQRIQDLIEIALPSLKQDEETRHSVLLWFNLLATRDSPDVAFLQKFRPWIDNEDNRSKISQSSPRLQFLDLLSGSPSAASPQLEAIFTANNSWQVSWSLAGYRRYRNGNPFARKFPFLDGLFDLEILAGPLSDRLEVVQTIPAAVSTGRVDVNLPPGSRFVSLLAKQRDGSNLRLANPVEVANRTASEAIALPAALERIPAAGPFFINDAFRLFSAPKTPLELSKLPWSVGAPAPQVSGWIQGGSATWLSLSFRTADDVEIEAKPLQTNTPDLDGMPLWQKFETPRDLTPPPATEKVVLVIDTTHYQINWPFQLSGLRLAAAASPAELPPGLSLLGRVPGMAGFLVMDPMANRFATASRNGIGVFDFSTGQFSGWIPWATPSDKMGIGWMALAGDRVVFAIETGDINVLSLGDRSVRKVANIAEIDRHRELSDSIQLSPDSKFLAWNGVMAGTRLLELDAPEGATERLIETPQNVDLVFDVENRKFEAWGAGNRYTLSLDDWETAPIAVTRGGDIRRAEKRSLRFSMKTYSTLADPKYQIDLKTDYNRKLEKLEVSHRTAVFPQGILGSDHDNLPFYIDPYGRVLRIAPEKLKGYEPPPEKK